MGWVVLLVVASVVWCSVGAWPQEDPRIDELLGKLKALTEDRKPAFVRQHVQIGVNGQVQQDRIQEVWVRDREHLRVDAGDGTVVLYTPEVIVLHHAPSKVVLLAPQATLDALGDRRQAELQALGLNALDQPFKLLQEGQGHLSISGEDVIADEPCWVLACNAELAARWKAVLAGIPAEFEVTVADIALEKETAMPRQLYFELIGPAALTISIVVEEVQENPEIADELFVFEAPDDVLTLTWTPEKSGAEMRKCLEETIAQRLTQQ
jgi:stage V sporulation protein SpoVS